MPYIARCSQPRACETSKPTRSVSLALAKSFGNAGVMGGMLGVAMAEVILHGAQIATLTGQLHRALQRAPGCALCEIELQISRLAEVQPKHRHTPVSGLGGRT